MRKALLLSLLVVAHVGLACSPAGQGQAGEGEAPGGSCTDNGAEAAEPSGIRPFASESELDAYVGEIEARSAAIAKCNADKGEADAKGAGEASPSQAGSPANDAITNNQEAGADEGGIVKNIGDALVVLRKGRLFVVDVAGAAPTLTDSMPVARSPGLNKGVWYDEMLVKGDLVYVVGYRYGVAAPGEDVGGATEIDTFRVSGGKLTRLKSMFLESNDYYSGQNYASRMVDGKLVFYMPHYVGRTNGTLAYPRLLETKDDGSFGVVGPLFGALDVYTSLVKPRSATFHTVVQCELPASGELACHGRAILGSWAREHYVSADAVYLWSNEHVYRFDLASLDVGAHRVEGEPVDQFSFRQTPTDLLVAVNQVRSNSDAASLSVKAGLLSIPLAAFDKRGAQASASAKLLAADTMIVKNRFVGDVLVASLASMTASASDAYGEDVVALEPKSGATTRTTAPHGVTRLEPLGAGRVLVVSRDGSSGLTLDARPVSDLGKSLGQVNLPSVDQGEGRSHGFFYKPGEAGAGMFGYAIVAQSASDGGWGNGISNIGFFDVASNGALASRGIVGSGTDASKCQTSCVDWYGNTRPIFLGSRTFALMGSELAAVSIAGGNAVKGAGVTLTW